MNVVAPQTSDLKPRAPATAAPKDKIAIRNFDFYYGETKALKNVSLPLYANQARLSSDRPAAASRRCFGCSTGCTTSTRVSAPRGRSSLMA